MSVAKSKQLANMGTCAALYTVAIATTAFVPTHLRVGQFRLRVVIHRHLRFSWRIVGGRGEGAGGT